MKHLLQNLENGETTIIDIPAPEVEDGHLLIETSVSLVSPGTEKMLIDFGNAGYLKKITQQPDKVKKVLDKVKTDGLLSTYEAVKSKLNMPRNYDLGGAKYPKRSFSANGLCIGTRSKFF